MGRKTQPTNHQTENICRDDNFMLTYTCKVTVLYPFHDEVYGDAHKKKAKAQQTIEGVFVDVQYH